MPVSDWNRPRAPGKGGALALALLGGLTVAGCRAQSAPPPEDSDGPGDSGDGSAGSDTADPPPETATLTHSFGMYSLAPLEELQPCIQWTPGNEQPLYVQAVTLASDGGYHHSNWFVAPEELYPGDDGFFPCSDRDFSELDAATQGTVLTAQSTQSRYERMALPPGVVVKIPPRHKILAGAHLLNLADEAYETEMRLSLELIHPREVEVVVVPFRMSYYALDLPPFTRTRFTGRCNIGNVYESTSGRPFDLKIYYLLPHYHYLGDYFDLSVLGGPGDGQSVFRLEGFNADANGQAYPEPVDLTGADGLSFSCGYHNWTDKSLLWGVGDNEMCVMLGLADSRTVIDASVGANTVVGTDGELLLNQGPCGVLSLPKDPAQSLPTDQELEVPLYVPPSDPSDEDLLPIDPCVDAPAASAPPVDASLTRLRDTLLVSSCQYSSCHDGAAAAAGLDLAAPDLHTELLDHVVQGPTDLPLVAPGDPEGSWLYRLVSRCEPTGRDDQAVAHMPLNSPRLADEVHIARLRGWIEAGAPDN